VNAATGRRPRRVDEDPARAAVVAAVAAQLEPGMLLGLGSGRAVWALIDTLKARWAGRLPRVVVASSATEARAAAAGFEIISLDGTVTPDVAVDGADELDRTLNLIKGHGAALLREKLVVAAADRFLVLAERAKLVGRLGEGMLLPVEVVRFAWAQTRRRLLEVVPEATLRLGDDRTPIVTDENHYLLDCIMPEGRNLAELSRALKATLGVVEHGLFLGMADQAFLGTPEGRVETFPREWEPPAGRSKGARSWRTEVRSSTWTGSWWTRPMSWPGGSRSGC
jgi:ribose 5-phosphate isomerase A